VNGSTNGHPAIARFARHVNPALVRILGILGYGRVFVGAAGTRVRDSNGRDYLDFLSGFGSANLGHNHPALIRRLHEFLDEGALNLVHVGPSIAAADLAEALCNLAGGDLEIALFSNGGSEGVEEGIKLARAATKRAGVLSCDVSFHGLSLGTLSLSASGRMRRPFEPLLPGCERVPYGDLDALTQALATGRFATFVVEPIAAEGGVRVPPPGYLAAAQEACRRNGTLLILDEVQTGLGRTGSFFAFQQEGFIPDVLVIAKALGGSLTPIGATLTSRKIQNKAYGSARRFDLHGSTFAGNGLSCAAALETLRILSDEKLVENSADRGRELIDRLRSRLAGHPLVREIRGRGLLVGIELGPPEKGWLHRAAPRVAEGLADLILGQWASVKLLERGVLCQPSSQDWRVLRLEPPLTVCAEEIRIAVDAVEEVLADYRELGPLMKDVAVRIGKQALSGGRFP
jgi:putrescine aminotransferase